MLSFFSRFLDMNKIELKAPLSEIIIECENITFPTRRSDLLFFTMIFLDFRLLSLYRHKTVRI